MSSLFVISDNSTGLIYKQNRLGAANIIANTATLLTEVYFSQFFDVEVA